uniref:Envelope glycoprotein n=1 Tax=Molossus molossus TaxID=27622 RepID=A0A7J8I859_MOLMO|nr:hypothetical protein HJG59_010589 [Molossus molossus]
MPSLLKPMGFSQTRSVFRGLLRCLLLAIIAHTPQTIHPWLRSKKRYQCTQQRTAGLSPLIGAALSSTLTVWEAETVRRTQPLIHLFSLHFLACLTEAGAFFMCGSTTYMCLPTNWTGTCTLVYLTPNINIVPQDASLPVPDVTLINTRRHKRAIQLVPLLTALSITGALGLGAGGLGTSLSYFHILSEDLQNSLEEIASTLLSIQDQLDSLAAVTLQNRRGLDLLTAEKGGICVFLEEQCCFYLNQSGLVRNAANNLKERAQCIRERRDQSWST